MKKVNKTEKLRKTCRYGWYWTRAHSPTQETWGVRKLKTRIYICFICFSIFLTFLVFEYGHAMNLHF